MQHPVMFFILYWTTEIAYGVLTLMAIREVFATTFEAYFGLKRSRLIPILALLGITGVSLWRAAYRPIGRGGSLGGLAAGAYAFVLGVLCLEGIAFLVCLRLAFRRPYPVRWGRYRLGILAGFGLSACSSAVAFLARFNFGPRFESVFHYVLPGAYIGAAASWLFTFLGKELPPSERKTDIETVRRALDYVTRETEEAEKDLGLRLVDSAHAKKRRAPSQAFKAATTPPRQ